MINLRNFKQERKQQIKSQTIKVMIDQTMTKPNEKNKKTKQKNKQNKRIKRRCHISQKNSALFTPYQFKKNHQKKKQT